MSKERSELNRHNDDRLRLTGDRPKEHLADDRLGYARFAQSLARSIADLAPTEGIVLAVNGPWGSGKTTAVNMIVEAVGALQPSAPSGREILPIRFNPWWFSEQEDLVKAFFAELSASLDKKLSEKVGEGFRNVARRIASSRDLVVAGLGLVPGGSLVKDVTGAAIGAVGSLGGSDKSLSQLRDELAADLHGQDKRLLVIIDDVDRLPANEVRQIFRLVKSVADLPNVIYLLIFDREVAERAFEGPATISDPSGMRRSSRRPSTCRPFSASISTGSSSKASTSWRARWMSPIQRGGEMSSMTASLPGCARRAMLVGCSTP